MENSESILDLTFKIGETLLINGAEISRVQDTMERVANSLGAEKFDAYVLSNALFVSGVEKGTEKTAQLKHVPSTTIHLGRISAINQLSREITNGKCNISQANERVCEINNIPYSSLLLLIFACAVASAGFCYLFGGTFLDSLSALLIGILLEIFLHFTKKMHLSKFLVNLSASAFITIIALLFFHFHFGDNMDKMIIGPIMRLVPGVALTNSIRDFFNGDYLSGTIRMIDALLIGGCIAIGVGTVSLIFAVLTGGALL